MQLSRRGFLRWPLLGCGLAGLPDPTLDGAEKEGVATVAGTVLDAVTLTPLAGVAVGWRSHGDVSDTAGHYHLELPVGIREISFSVPHRPTVRKIVILREPGSRARQDALLPSAAGAPGSVLALDHGSRSGQHGRDLACDVSADSSISLADEYGNNEQLLQLNVGRNRVHSPVWLSGTAIAFAKEGLHGADDLRGLGVFQFQTSPPRIQKIAYESGIRFLSKAPGRDALAVAGDKDLYVIDSIEKPQSLRRIFGLDPHQGFFLSTEWAADDRIYFTVDERVQLDDRHYFTRSRIGSINSDGTDLKPDWATNTQYSYRYPVNAESGEIIFCRFTLDGKEQTLWMRNSRTGKVRRLLEPALRAVHLDTVSKRLYYIHKQDLHLRNLDSGADWVIVNSVREANYLRSVKM